jgi:hypothetical protein
VLAPDDRGAALYWRPVPRKHEPTAPTSGKRRLVGQVPLPGSRPQPEHGPGYSLCPTREGRDHSSTKATGRPEGRPSWTPVAGNTPVPRVATSCHLRSLPPALLDF